MTPLGATSPTTPSRGHPPLTLQSRMRVLYVDYSLGFGGSFKSLALAFRGLPDVDKILVTSEDEDLVRTWFPNWRARRFRRLVNYRTVARLGERSGPPILKWLALKLIALADLVADQFSSMQLYALIRRFHVDLVHLNNGPIAAGARAARLAGVPCVVHARGLVQDPEAFDARIAHQQTAVIAVSHLVARTCEPVCTPTLVATIYDPVDLNAIDRARHQRALIRISLGVDDTTVVFGLFGRVVPWKGQLEFAQAAVLSMRAVPSVRALIVGDESDGGPGYFRRVQSFINESGFADRFILAGYRADVEAYYAAVDVVVHASIEPEPFGMVVPEAMAAAKPVIATNAGGPREVVEDGITGILVDMGDVQGMADAMVRLAGDPSMRRAMGRAGRQRVAQFGIEAHGDQVRSVYSALLQQPSPSSRAS